MASLQNRWLRGLLLIVCSLFFLTSGCVSTGKEIAVPGKIDTDSLTVKGKVQKISLEEGVMVVAPRNGDHITLKFTRQTPVNCGEIMAITKFQVVQVSYKEINGVNKARYIEMLPDGSCSGK